MGLDIKTLAAANSNAKQILKGSGGIQEQPGKDGKDAPTITKVDVDENNVLLTTLSDGTTLTGGTIKTISGINGTDGVNGTDGKDGRSIQSITKDENDNIIVTFSDGTIQNIGKLSVDVQADFLTEDGFGNIRYYNGKFQSYQNGVWVDITPTSDNTIVVNMMPNPMQRIIGIYDHENGRNKLKWLEPEDTVVDGQIICVVDKVVIRRKLGSVPQNENDGDIVIEVSKKDFNSHNSEWYIDSCIIPEIGDIYYYKAFPVSTTGFANRASVNEVSIKPKDHYLYGFIIDQNESDPESMISYIEDNKDFKPVYMNYENNTFDYGDWEDTWFIKTLKPCVLGFNGEILYEIDKNNYTKKLDGSDSNIDNDDLPGNVMIGIPKVYWKIQTISDDKCEIRFSDKNIDGSYKCWAHLDSKGNEIDYCYMPAYNGTVVSDKLRSLSGKPPVYSKTINQEISLAKSNNMNTESIWYIEIFSDRILINLLLMLIGKSTDTQTVFGTGSVIGGNSGQESQIYTGTMDRNGLFFGNSSYDLTGVKVFGMEHWWGNQLRSVAGFINNKGTIMVKLTCGQKDGSTVSEYNTNGNGYISITTVNSNESNGYISKMKFANDVFVPKTSGGSASTAYCDYVVFNNSVISYAACGGVHTDGVAAGAFYVAINRRPEVAEKLFASSISCKPLANEEGVCN